MTYLHYKKPSAKTNTIKPHEMTTTTTQQNATAATAAAAAAAAAARDSLKTAELHHSFAQDIRQQVEAEYNAAVDEEIAACGDMERKIYKEADLQPA